VPFIDLLRLAPNPVNRQASKIGTDSPLFHSVNNM